MREKTLELAKGPNFAVLTTLLPDGTPQTHVMWVGTDEKHILLNTEVHRTKFANLETDPRATVTIIDADDPYSYAEVRGKVVDRVTGDEARHHLDELSRKYTGSDYSNKIQSERVILKVAPDREVIH